MSSDGCKGKHRQKMIWRNCTASFSLLCTRDIFVVYLFCHFDYLPRSRLSFLSSESSVCVWGGLEMRHRGSSESCSQAIWICWHLYEDCSSWATNDVHLIQENQPISDNFLKNKKHNLLDAITATPFPISHILQRCLFLLPSPQVHHLCCLN